jgi:hypothetical protein
VEPNNSAIYLYILFHQHIAPSTLDLGLRKIKVREIPMSGCITCSLSQIKLRARFYEDNIVASSAIEIKTSKPTEPFGEDCNVKDTLGSSLLRAEGGAPD